MAKKLQEQISELETLIMLNQPPMTLTRLQTMASGLTDKEYLRFLVQFLAG